jgi:hypothetical protein
MQPTIHLRGKAGYLQRPYLGLCSKCIVGCIFKSLRLIITRETPCRFFHSWRRQKINNNQKNLHIQLKSIATPPLYLNQLQQYTKICTLSRRLHHFYKIYIAIFFSKYYRYAYDIFILSLFKDL